MKYGMQDWLNHMHTAALINKYEATLRFAHDDLLKLCSETQDADIRGAHERYRSVERMVQELKGQLYQKERSDDE